MNNLFMDERNKLIAYKVIAIMYFITITALVGVVFYRQFGLGQEVNEFEDLAIIMTFNSIFLISALLYFGAVSFRQIKIKTILLVYLWFVVLGSLFTYAKYNIFQSPGLSMAELLDKLIIIFIITGLMMLFFVLFSYLGSRRLEKDLE